MAHDELLAARMRAALGSLPGMEEKKMFDGIGFLVNGNMACGVNKNDLIVRVGPEKHAAALARPHTRLFDMTGHPMTGWIVVDPAGCETESELKAWLELGLAFARSLPGK
jgi:TfoX/Sxy family transcriptional regulator of competence genes